MENKKTEGLHDIKMRVYDYLIERHKLEMNSKDEIYRSFALQITIMAALIAAYLSLIGRVTELKLIDCTSFIALLLIIFCITIAIGSILIIKGLFGFTYKDLALSEKIYNHLEDCIKDNTLEKMYDDMIKRVVSCTDNNISINEKRKRIRRFAYINILMSTSSFFIIILLLLITLIKEL